MKTFHNPANQQINFLDERFYTVDNINYYPSVTTVLGVYPKGYGFYKWLKENGEDADEILEKAGEQGSKVHDAIDQIIKGHQVKWTHTFVDTLQLQTVESAARFVDDCNNGLVTKYYKEVQFYTLEEWKMILRFVEFVESHNPIFIANEFNIVSIRYRLGGTLDIVVDMYGERWLIDIKTSNYLHKIHELQLAAYAVMFNDENPESPITRTGILWLKAQTWGAYKKGKSIQGNGWQLKEFDRHFSESFALFQHIRAIWDEENPNYQPKNITFPDRINLQVLKASAA
jgi:CRISPR/Cas system-associated exonuclease Cas4 (RecB family)